MLLCPLREIVFFVIVSVILSRSTRVRSSAASDGYKGQVLVDDGVHFKQRAQFEHNQVGGVYSGNRVQDFVAMY